MFDACQQCRIFYVRMAGSQGVSEKTYWIYRSTGYSKIVGPFQEDEFSHRPLCLFLRPCHSSKWHYSYSICFFASWYYGRDQIRVRDIFQIQQEIIEVKMNDANTYESRISSRNSTRWMKKYLLCLSMLKSRYRYTITTRAYIKNDTNFSDNTQQKKKKKQNQKIKKIKDSRCTKCVRSLLAAVI